MRRLISTYILYNSMRAFAYHADVSVETSALWLATLTAGPVVCQVVAILRGARPVQRYDTLDAREVYEFFIAPLYKPYVLFSDSITCIQSPTSPFRAKRCASRLGLMPRCCLDLYGGCITRVVHNDYYVTWASGPFAK